MVASRRQFIVAGGAAGFLTAARKPVAGDYLTPEMFGAKGDGRTNDTDAFAALSAHVNAHGGGNVILRRVTYIVGKQHTSDDRTKFAFAPSDILHFSGCKGAIVIRGNGAVLRCTSGLRYGGFDRAGRVLPEARSNLDLANRAVPYLGMIHAENCTGSIDISDVELDGNLGGFQIGGKYGKGGWQAGASGIRFSGNTGSERLSRIRSHHHPQDGISITGSAERVGSTTISDVVCEENGRVGFSLLGGHDYSVERGRFRRNGKAGMRSAPAAGVDMETERPPTRNVSFSDCEFSDNAGFGFVSPSKKASDITCTRCKFVGTTNLAGWLDSPRMRFRNCLFVGSINHVFGDTDPTQAAQFLDCTFTDDPGLSPTGEVFLGGGQRNWIAVVQRGTNVLFSRCNFRLLRDGLLPLSQSDVIYADCKLSQRSPALSNPRGTYIGTNVITGNVQLKGSVIRGQVTLNGRLMHSE